MSYGTDCLTTLHCVVLLFPIYQFNGIPAFYFRIRLKIFFTYNNTKNHYVDTNASYFEIFRFSHSILCPLLEKDVLQWFSINIVLRFLYPEFRKSYNVISSSGHSSTLDLQRTTNYCHFRLMMIRWTMSVTLVCLRSWFDQLEMLWI